MNGFRLYNKNIGYYENPAIYLNYKGELVAENENGGIYKIDQSVYVIERDTGIKDKNGKSIYAGDIVNESFLGKTVVKWLDDKCGYNISKSFEYNDGRCKFESESYYEIIGNIHENKDLLEATNE